MSKTIAAFDFDGTLTTKDTLFDFITFCFGKPKLAMGMFKILPVLLSYKAGLMSNEKAKEIMFAHFFKGITSEQFTRFCESYAPRISQIVNPVALEKFKWHQAQGHTVVIVSASIEDWIIPWAMQQGVHLLIGTKVIIEKGVVSGKFESRNCYGQEKVNRLLSHYPKKEEFILYAYGDSSGDKELLALADHAFFRKFN